MNTETAYWMALAHELPAWSFSDKDGWKNENKMNLIIRFYHEKKTSITDFFGLSEERWKDDFQLNDRQVADLQKVKSALANYAFIAESLQNSGVEVIPVVSPEYSKTLKENLKKSAPPILYIKGNKQIMQEKSVAIVGSREASEVALNFTDNIAKQASKDRKVIISGFAKGIDKQALDSAIACKGHSIIVLPQGIMTFESGFKTYYKQIIDGDVLVLSTFHPKAGWGKELAMARNPIIYGLAKEIYVAESKSSRNRQGKETKGGTYAGVMDGLKKGRIIYVRKPDASEKNDNNSLIQGGAIAVDFNGNKLDSDQMTVVKPESEHDFFADNVKEILQNEPLAANDILKKLNLDWKPEKLTRELKKLDLVKVKKERNKNYFSLKGTESPNLFEFS
jgi:predicted Rossmann fold nucleotide-binding protein DprA/Smf involved in DNA uptake